MQRSVEVPKVWSTIWGEVLNASASQGEVAVAAAVAGVVTEAAVRMRVPPEDSHRPEGP